MSLVDSKIQFENTEVAFAHQSDRQLRQSLFLFGMMSRPALVKLGTRFTPWAVRIGLPILGLLRKTIFRQFVGGETLEETRKAADALNQYKVDVILDYGVEGTDGEANFDLAQREFIRVIDHAATCPNIPFMSIKVTGLARFALLEKMHQLIQLQKGKLMERYRGALQQLMQPERTEWSNVEARLDAIAAAGQQKRIGVLIDAEESWIQDPIDALSIELMQRYNRDRVVVFNTYQLYRHDRLSFLVDTYHGALDQNFLLGAKLVRGAYMEKERKRARKLGYPSPIQVNKAASDRDYDNALAFCVEHLDRIFLMVASHNESSSLYVTRLMIALDLPLNHPHVHWSQLYGMSDNITFNLANAGCSVSKYLPFGPIREVIPYLMRRAQENTSVRGQTSRELNLLLAERARRRNTPK